MSLYLNEEEISYTKFPNGEIKLCIEDFYRNHCCAKGFLSVNKTPLGYQLNQNVSVWEENRGDLQTVFEDGKLTKDYTFEEIRENLKNEN